MSFSFSELMISILLILYHSDEPMSRYRIAKKLDVSRQSVSANVKRLINSGLIESTPEGIRLPDFFHNPEVRNLFEQVFETLSEHMDFEEMLSNSDSHSIELLLKQMFTIMVLLSNPNLSELGHGSISRPSTKD